MLVVSGGGKGLRGGEPGGLERWVDPGCRADAERGGDGEQQGQGRDDGVPVPELRIHGGGESAEDGPGGSAGEGEQGGFGEELGRDVGAAGAQGTPQPD